MTYRESQFESNSILMPATDIKGQLQTSSEKLLRALHFTLAVIKTLFDHTHTVDCTSMSSSNLSFTHSTIPFLSHHTLEFTETSLLPVQAP